MQATPNQQSDSANRQIARAAGTVMVAMVLSQAMGLIAKMLTSRAFGTGMESEAFFAANRFAEIIFNLVAGGALGSAFIPTFTGLLANEKRKQAWRLASAIANLVLLILTLVSILSAIFAQEVVHYILAPGFGAADPAKEALAVELLRIQLPSSIIFGLSGLIMGILNAHQHFLLPALAPSLYQVGWIFGILVLSPEMGVFGLAWGIVIGSALHLVVQLPRLLKLHERKYTPSLGLKLPDVREVARLMGPRLLGVAVVQLNFLVNTLLASYQPEGSVTALSLAFPLMIMPQAAIAQSIAIAALPTFSAQYARGKLSDMRHSLAATLRGVLFLAIPASAGLVLLREPLVALIYQGGEFTIQSTQMVAWALLWYGLGLIGHSVVEIVSRAFYALHDTKTPVFIGIAAMSLNLGFSFLFTYLFRIAGWMPHGGLALANSLATFLEMIALLVIMRRRLEGLEGGRILKGVLFATTAALAMSIAIILWLNSAITQAAILIVLVAIVAAVIVYFGLLLLFRVDELQKALQWIKTRFLSRSNNV